MSKYLISAKRIPGRGLAVLAVSAMAIATVLLFPGPAMGITTTVDPDKTSYLLGEKVVFDGQIDFSDGETKDITSVTLTVNGSQGFSQILPVYAGSYSLPTNNLEVLVTWSGIGYGYGYGYGYTGTGNSAKIEYQITWDAPILLTPPPTYSLAPNTVEVFDIPQATSPSLPAGLPDPLPTLTTGFDIPTLVAVDPNAPDSLPSLTALGTAIPLKSGASSGPGDLAATGAVDDVAFEIPTVTDDLIAGVGSAPDSTALVATTDDILGIARDGNDNIYALVDGGGGVDQIKKYNSSGAVVSGFGSSGVADVKDGNGTDITLAKGIATADGKLWVTHSQSALDHQDGGGGGTKRWIQQFDISDGSYATECYLYRQGPEDNLVWPITGIGDYIWGYNEDNNSIQRWDVTSDCSGLDRDKDQGMDYSLPAAVAIYSQKLYSIDGNGNISTHNTQQPGQTETTLSQTITGYTDDIGGFQMDSSGVYYLASSDNGSAISKSQGASTMTTSPRGLTYDTVNTQFYVLVNGSGGNDRIIVTDTSGSQVGSSIDTGETEVEGITYKDGNIWAVFGGDNNDAKIKAYDISNSSWGNDVTLSVNQNNRDFRGLAYDGEEFLLGIQGGDGNITQNETNGDLEANYRMSWNAQYTSSGAEAATYHSSKGHYYFGKGDDIVAVATLNGQDTEETLAYNDLDSATSLGGGGVKVKGLTIVGSVIYIADDRNDAILKASLPTGETTTPQALANDGTYLWLVTDGTAGADTLLKLNASTGAKEAAFTLGHDDVQGMTFVGSELWIMVNGGNNSGCKIQKIDVSDGSNDGSAVNIGDGGWCDGFGGMSSDGDDVFVMSSGQSQYKSFDTSGNADLDKNIDDMSSGGRAVAINSGGQNWIGRGDTIDAFTAGSWNMEAIADMRQEDLTVTGGLDLDVKGMTWMGSVLYIADDETDYIYKTAAPAGANSLLGMTTDGTDLYLLLNNTPKDSIMKVSTSGTKDTSWGTNGVIDTNQSDANSVAVFDSQLWVAELNQGCCGSDWAFQGYNISNGNAGNDFTYNQVPMGQALVKGLASDGTSLIVGHNQMNQGGMGGLIKFDDNGNDIGENIQLSDQANALTALAYRSNSPQVITALNDDITTYGSDGTESDTYTLGGSINVDGLAAIGHVLYLGDTDSNTVKKASIPLTVSNITTEPKGMAVDGGNIWMVVEANPKDYLIKVDTDGALVTGFNSGGSAELPVDDVEGIAVIGDYLYIVNMASGSCPPSCGGATGKVYKLNKTTAEEESSFSLNEPCQGGPCYDSIGGLSTNADGDALVIALGSSGCYQCNVNYLLVDPDNPNNADEIYGISVSSAGAVEAANDFYYVASNNTLGKYEEGNQPTDWSSVGSPDNLTGVSDIKGLAYLGTTMYLANYDYNSLEGKVRGVTLDENIPELTIVGDYSAVLSAAGDGFTTVTDTSSTFAFAKATSSTVAVTSPVDGFSVFTKAMPISGTVNDPAVETVSVGVDLPFTELFVDAADAGATSTGKMTATGLWNKACESDNDDVKSESGTCSWYYGSTNDMNYDNGAQNSGGLQLKDAISIVSADVSFTFDTWWDTEPGVQYDRKIVQVSTNGTSWTNLAMVIGPWDIDPNNGQPYGKPSELNSIQQWLPVPQAAMNFGGGGGGGGGGMPGNMYDPYANQGGGGGSGEPLWESVEVDLSAYVGQSIYIRFWFDTMDPWVNDMQGWFVDNIEIGGAGFDGTTASVTAATSAQKTAGVYGNWTTTFNLAEGVNTIKVNSANPYDTSLTSSVQIAGFLDTTPPTITIDESGINSPTNAPTATITGTIDDINFQELAIVQTTNSGSKTIVTVKTLPANKTFSKVASLSEGTNTFVATAKDGAGLTASATVAVVLDTTGPVLTINTPSYPLGATSGRQGDVVIFSVDSTSTGSAVDRLEVTYPGGGGTQRFKPAAAIPEAIRDLWAVTGQFILATRIPDNASPGNYGLTVKAYDEAGNQSTANMNASVVSSLEAFNVNLMPDWNLVSLPLMPDSGAITTMTNGVNGIQSVWYYDATSDASDPADRWLVYTPSQQDVDTLSTFATGRGYWFKMDPQAFTMSAALGAGLPQTPKAIKMTYSGQFVAPGTLPPSYMVTTGWNAMGFHSENILPVTTALQSLESPQRIWGSLLQYNNRIVFEIPENPSDEPTFEILLGAFERLLTTSDLTPGFGYWIYMVEDGVITP